MIWVFVPGIISYLLVGVLRPIFEVKLRQNYLGETVPNGLGYAFIMPSTLIMIILAEEKYGTLFALTILFFSSLGAIDDYLGDSSRRGFYGHFANSTMSTGILKAVGGAIGALVMGSLLANGWLDVLINGALIALAANFINLLDSRPGRAGKSFLIFALPLFLWIPSDLVPLACLFWAVIGYLPWDLRRSVMMGDTGSNALGAALGLAVVIVLPRFVNVFLLLILLGLNTMSERVSFSRVIEGNRALHFMDRLGQKGN